ncbi:VOC family protein [Curvibacter sp. APW13]|uniref:VOC family protein n=1 Tax=Curvibacter sp. APW13 TaxID=3077236 RepID=UPI0028DF983C|nr:VOC family protein [Curvibacter sp. APW13]MDT8989367.1 VOC family protein [Curvibacter sp. APW13]
MGYTMHSDLKLAVPIEYPEEQRPSHVQKLERPQPLVKASRLAFLRFGKPDLDQCRNFWSDFGLRVVESTPMRLCMGTADGSPVAIVATKSAKPRFLGAAFEVDADVDWQDLLRRTAGRALGSDELPGGGSGIECIDPEGFAVWLIAPQARVDVKPVREAVPANGNTFHHANRINATVRTPIEPATVGRLGHYVLQTPRFAEMAQWYMSHLGLIPSDVQYLPDGSPLLAFFRLDKGGTPVDHHTVVIASGLKADYEHSAYEVADLDALGQGQQVMRAAGHEHFWGIGRHVLGSQLFDYWSDHDKHQFEHYTDGDVFTADRPTHYVPFAPGSIWAWGDDAPREIFPQKSLGMLWRAIQLVRRRVYSLDKLKAMAAATDQPARPWL